MQETGYTSSGLPIYIIEYNKYLEYAGATEEQIAKLSKESSYDAETGTISFAVAYVVFYSTGEYYGAFAGGIETFVLADGHKFPAASGSSQKSSVSKVTNPYLKGFAGLSLEFTPRLAEFSATVSDRSFDRHSFKSNLVEFAE